MHISRTSSYSPKTQIRTNEYAKEDCESKADTHEKMQHGQTSAASMSEPRNTTTNRPRSLTEIKVRAQLAQKPSPESNQSCLQQKTSQPKDLTVLLRKYEYKSGMFFPENCIIATYLSCDNQTFKFIGTKKENDQSQIEVRDAFGNKVNGGNGNPLTLKFVPNQIAYMDPDITRLRGGMENNDYFFQTPQDYLTQEEELSDDDKGSSLKTYAHATPSNHRESIHAYGIYPGNGETRGLPEGNRPGVYAWREKESVYVTPAHEIAAIFSKDSDLWKTNRNSDGGVVTENNITPARSYANNEGAISVTRPLTPRTVAGMNRFHADYSKKQPSGNKGAQALLDTFNSAFPNTGFPKRIPNQSENNQPLTLEEIERQADAGSSGGMIW